MKDSDNRKHVYEYFKLTAHGSSGLFRQLEYGEKDRYTTVTTSGYETGFGPAVLDTLKDGCICVDIRPLDAHPDFVRMVFQAPLVSLTRPAKAFDFADVDPIFAGAMAQGGNSYGGMLAMAATGHMSLDLVSPVEMARYWRDCGAPVGVYHEATNSIEWKA